MGLPALPSLQAHRAGRGPAAGVAGAADLADRAADQARVPNIRYNLTLGVNARNILNHENLNTPNGALTSPYFLQSTGITGGYGAEATASNQRRIDLQLRFTF